MGAEDACWKKNRKCRTMQVVLCCGKKGCAKVVLVADGVEIGEANNLAKLTAAEWNLLVNKRKSGELKKIVRA